MKQFFDLLDLRLNQVINKANIVHLFVNLVRSTGTVAELTPHGLVPRSY